MTTTARVAVLPQDGNELRIEDVLLPDPGPNEVEVRLYASGICHSQLHEIHTPRENPVVLGHEATGIVSKTGRDVNHVSVGDTVLVTWVPRNAAEGGAPPKPATLQVADGVAKAASVYTWADVTLADQQYIVKVDPEIAKDVTSVIGCAVMTGAGAVINTVDIAPGDSVAVFGVGGVGLCAVAAARVAGADPIIAVDLDDEKLALARNFGATHAINASTENPVQAIHRLTVRDGEFTYMKVPVSGVDFAFDCIGVATTMKQILAACRRGQFRARQGGTAVLVGLPTGKAELNAMDIVVSEKNFRGSFCGSCIPDVDVPRFIDWYRNGQLDLEALVTRRYRLDDINEAVAALESGEILGRAIVEFDA